MSAVLHRPVEALGELRSILNPQQYLAALERLSGEVSLGRYGGDPVAWCDEFAWGVDYEASPPAEYKASLRPWQRGFMADLAAGQGTGQRRVVLKSRGVGASWAAIWYASWLLWARAPAQILMMSDTETKAWELMRRHRFVTRHLPASLGYPRPGRDDSDSLSSRVFPNGSEIHSLSGDPEGIRSYHPSLIIVDEAAKLRTDPRAALVGTKADAVVMSTAEGMDNAYAEIWHDAYLAGGEVWGYKPLFVSWRERGDLTRRPVGDPVTIAQEYPDTPEEAFTSRMGKVFPEFTEANILPQFPVPKAWPMTRAHDPGVRGAGWVWASAVVGVNELRMRGWPGLPADLRDGDVIIWHEWEPRDVPIEQQAAKVKQWDVGLKCSWTGIDPSDARQQTGRGLRTTAELLGDCGIMPVVKAPNDETAFILKAKQAFLNRRYWLLASCTGLRRQIESEVWATVAGEAEAREGAERRQHAREFHLLSAFKYLLMLEPELASVALPRLARPKRPTTNKTGY